MWWWDQLDEATASYLLQLVEDTDGAFEDVSEQRDAIQAVLDGVFDGRPGPSWQADELLSNKAAFRSFVVPDAAPAAQQAVPQAPSTATVTAATTTAPSPSTGSSKKSRKQQRGVAVDWFTGTASYAAEAAASSSSSSANTTVCQFFLTDSCLRADCPFIHDTAAVVCRYWLQGECIKGDDGECPFAHSLPMEEDEEQGTFDDQQDEYYYHIAEHGADSSSSSSSSSDAASSFSTAVRVGQLVEQFAGVNKMILVNTLLAHDGDVDLAAADLGKQFARSTATTTGKASKPVAATLAASARPFSQQQLQQSRRIRLADTAQQDVWVDTGMAVTKLYKELRAEAADHAKARNKFFQEATIAYKCGNGAAAKRLSQLGRWHQTQMNELHERASQSMLEARNSNTGSGKAVGGHVYDLHGQHVAEAIKFVDNLLGNLTTQEHYCGPVVFIVGTGHHSKDARRGWRRAIGAQAHRTSACAVQEGASGCEYRRTWRHDPNYPLDHYVVYCRA